MLRHYDELGLLPPERVDPDSGYRFYSVHQLGRLHRIVALRDIGFSLEQIGQILTQDISVDELRGMLRLRQAQIEQAVGEERDRLRRVEAHLRALEWRDIVEPQHVVIKQTDPVRVAQASASDGGAVPEGELVLHAGFVIGDQAVPSSEVVRVVDLPSIEVAAAVYRGGDEGIMAAWEVLVRWIDGSGYRLVGDCRELYHEWHDDDPSANVMELQQPIAR